MVEIGVWEKETNLIGRCIECGKAAANGEATRDVALLCVDSSGPYFPGNYSIISGVMMDLQL
jgi:hypothetical protein